MAVASPVSDAEIPLVKRLEIDSFSVDMGAEGTTIGCVINDVDIGWGKIGADCALYFIK